MSDKLSWTIELVGLCERICCWPKLLVGVTPHRWKVEIRRWRTHGEIASYWCVSKLADQLMVSRSDGVLSHGSRPVGWIAHELPSTVSVAPFVVRLQQALDVAGDLFRATGDLAGTFRLIADELVDLETIVQLVDLVTSYDGVCVVDPAIDPERVARLHA